MITNLGLILIIAAWSFQFFKKGKTLKPGFVLIYSLGVGLLVIDGYLSGSYRLAFFNFISLLSALAVYYKFTK